MSKKDRKTATIVGVRVDGTSLEGVLGEIVLRIGKNQKTFVVTPNPEFIVYANRHKWFKEILNNSDFSIPDGTGLVLASGLLAGHGSTISNSNINRIAGSDLAAGLLKRADRENWSVGIAGARRGITGEAEMQIGRLRKKYHRAKFVNLDQGKLGFGNTKMEIVLACHGMAKQEKWINDNIKTVPGLVFLGIGGSLDFLTGFSRRAPVWVRKIGFEWLWRGVQKPAHFRRVWTATAGFGRLVLKEKLRL